MIFFAVFFIVITFFSFELLQSVIFIPLIFFYLLFTFILSFLFTSILSCIYKQIHRKRYDFLKKYINEDFYFFNKDTAKEIYNNLKKIENKKLLKLLKNTSFSFLDVLDYDDYLNENVIDFYSNSNNEKLFSSFLISKINILNEEDYLENYNNIIELIESNITEINLKNEILDSIDDKDKKINLYAETNKRIKNIKNRRDIINIKTKKMTIKEL